MNWSSDKFLYTAIGVLSVLLVVVAVLTLSAQNEVKKQRQSTPSADGLQLDTNQPANQQLQQPADSFQSTGQNPSTNLQQPSTDLQNPGGVGDFLQYQQGGGLQ